MFIYPFDPEWDPYRLPVALGAHGGRQGEAIEWWDARFEDRHRRLAAAAVRRELDPILQLAWERGVYQSGSQAIAWMHRLARTRSGRLALHALFTELSKKGVSFAEFRIRMRQHVKDLSRRGHD